MLLATAEGMQTLRPFQLEALQALEDHQDILCSAPTGAGKSRIFLEYLRRHPEGTALLFSPLVALNRQHERTLNQSGVSAGRAGSESRVWILSPESLQVSGGVERAAKRSPSLVIIDEAHTVWEWGSHFRPAFSKIADVLRSCGRAKSLWLSATLSPAARQAVLALLPRERASSAHECGTLGIPPSLKIRVENIPWRFRLNRVLQFLETRKQLPGVIFCSTRTLTLQLSNSIQSNRTGLRAAAYHAGLSREERQALELQLAEGSLQILCATTAFGMGVDLNLLRWCIVWAPPATLLSLIQQVGRVTRGSAASEALLFWSESDLARLAMRTQNGAEPIQGVASFYLSATCRRASLLRGLKGEESGLAHPLGGAICQPPLLCDRCETLRPLATPRMA